MVKTTCILLFLLSLTASAKETPKWAQREKTIYFGKEHVWFLGIAEAKSLNKAQSMSEANAKRNMAEYLTDPSIKTNDQLSETLVTSNLNSTITARAKINIPIQQKRHHRDKSSGKWIIYTDIAVLESDIKELKKNRKTPKYDSAYGEVSDFDEGYENIYEDNESYFLETHHLISWSPFISGGATPSSFGYELSFFERLFGFEVNYISNSIESEDFNDAYNGYIVEDEERISIDLNVAVYRNYNQVLQLSVGSIRNDFTKRIDNDDSSFDEVEKNYTGTSYSIKYKRLFNNKNGGYLVSLRHQSMKGENKNTKKKISLERGTGEIGLFYSF